MARPTSPMPTDAERAILEVLWDKREASVREVTEALAQTKPVAYNTVLTMLKILDRKGFVHHRAVGRAFIYQASVSRSEVRNRALRRLLAQFFNGSPDALAQHLIAAHDWDSDELERLQQQVDAARASEPKS
ncbi:MAG: BlaI/MecI/CopY family transcriptional regulator [Xanthomonadales bacterium]|nr:BlaI/MecI/CopY family transcriptional regulator [Xanthomonadales bacterium]